MKIYNSQAVVNRSNIKRNSSNPNFKSISPTILKKVQASTTSNPVSKDIFIKLAGLTGLASLVAWVKSLSKEDNTEALNKLDVIDSKWIQQGTELFLNSEKQGQYMDVISRADSAESLIWTKGLLSQEPASDGSKEISSEEMDMFLEPEANEIYMSVSANKTLNTIMNQIKALSSATEEVRAQTMKSIEAKLNALVKQADELQNAEATAEIYSKVANIVKMFAVTNSISTYESSTSPNEQQERGVEPSILVVPEEVQEELKEEIINPSNKSDESSEKEAVAVEENGSAQSEDGDVDYPVRGKTLISQPVVLGKIELPDSSNKRIGKTDLEKTEEQPVTKEISITPENKNFVEQVLLKQFTKRSNIQPEVYADQIDFIQNVYEAYVDDGKETIGRNLIKNFSRQNTHKEIELYRNFTRGELGKFDFRAFLTLQTFKHINGGDITQEDFDLLEKYKDNVFKFFMLKEDTHKFLLAFCNGVSAMDKLKFALDFHKIAYNVKGLNLIKGEEFFKATATDIKEELKTKLSQNANDYERVMEYLDVPEETLDAVAAEIEDGNTEEARALISEALNSKVIDEKINGLVSVVNNPAFKDFIGGIHGRMRFVERILFSRQTNLTKTPYQMKQISSKLVEELKEQIEFAPNVELSNYIVRDNSGTSVHKYAPQIKVKGKTIGINDRGEIHTIY